MDSQRTSRQLINKQYYHKTEGTSEKINLDLSTKNYQQN
jgi:hypothetical protein